MVSTVSPLISVAELFQRMDDPALAIFDTSVALPSPRFDGDYRVESGLAQWSEGHIPTAHHLDLTHDLADTSASFSFALPPLEELATRFALLGITQQVTPVLYDKSDGFWKTTMWKAHWIRSSTRFRPSRRERMQQNNEALFTKGCNAGKPVEKSTSQVNRLSKQTSIPHSTFTTQPDLWCDREQVLRIVNGDAEGTLVCGLSQSVFNGTAPTRYSRRGHIPGSLNLPARALLDNNGCYRPVSELQDVLQPLLTRTPRPLVLYCGGGISAAVLAVALTLIGQTALCIYDGSLQEWSADPTLPLMTNPC